MYNLVRVRVFHIAERVGRTYMRPDRRAANELRPVKMTPGYIDYAEGSVLIEMGKTRVLCAVSMEERVPQWLVGRNQG